MIVHLLRNDLAGVARVGSVDEPELFAVKRSPTV
jgi:anthranilate/para-aminobenzoate synthase component I